MKRIGVVGIPGGWSTERLLDAVEAKTGFRCVIDMADVRLDLDTNKAVCKDIELTALDAIIVKKIAPTYSPDALDRMEILRFLYDLGLPVFSNPHSMLRLIDRLSCTTALRSAGIPMPATVITESISEAAATVERFGKAIFKPLYSSKARGMTVIEPGPEMIETIEDFKNNGNRVMYIQQMVSHAGKLIDLGVSYLGGKYLGTYARQGSGDSWDTTTRTGGKYVSYPPSKEVLELADKAQGLFDMAFTCVDVVETSDGPQVFEVSAFGGFRGLLESDNIDVAPMYVDHVLEKI